jgi:hypothetical protein
VGLVQPGPPSALTNARGCVKGGVLQSRIAYVRSRGGPGTVDLVLARLPEEHRRVLSDLILPVGWYPFEINVELDRAIELFFGGGRGLYREMGAQSAVDGLSTAYKNLVRARDPQGLLKHSAQIHKLFYDTGYRTYEWVSSKSAVLRTFDCKSYSMEDCLTNMGWHEKAISLSGGRSARATEPQCRARGGKCCEYVCQWE